MKTTAIGLVSDSCNECSDLRQRLIESFCKFGIDLEFVDVSYDDDPHGSLESLADLGMTSVPSFLVGGVVFFTYFSGSDVEKSVEAIKNE